VSQRPLNLVRYLTLEQVVAIHDAIATPGIRDAGAIAAAVARPQATVFGQDAYATVWEKAAALLHSLACNHGFVDGNKRAGWTCAMTFLAVNGHELNPGFDVDAAEEFMVAVAEGRFPDVPGIASELIKFSW
jgi:death on curing protein